jgi:hypothetical protein
VELLLDPFDSADASLRVTLLEEDEALIVDDDEDSSTYSAELLLSSSQAARNAEPHKTAVATVNFPQKFIIFS